MRDIRDVHTETVMTVIEQLHLDRVVEIARRLPVDGDDGPLTKIFPSLERVVT